MAANERWMPLAGYILLYLPICFGQTDVETTTQAVTTTTTTSPADNTEPTQNVQPNQDLAICTCNLLAGGCDVNCCCDPDCTQADLQAFTTCDDIVTPPNVQTCVQSSIMFRSNTPYTINETVPGLFCIERDNYESRNYFEVPELITTPDMFEQRKLEYGSYSFEPTQTDHTFRDTQYRSGESIYTVYESGYLGILSQPAPLSSSQCVDTNPAAFLLSLSYSCVRRVTTVGQACEKNPYLNAQTYYQGFRVISTPEVFQAVDSNDTTPGPRKRRRKKRQAPPEMTTADPGNFTEVEPPVDPLSLYNSSYAIELTPLTSFICIGVDGLNRTCDFTQVPIPTYEYDSSTQSFYCKNSLAEVTYYIETNGTDGISKVDVGFVFRDLSDDVNPINQVFKTEFSQSALGLSQNGTASAGQNSGAGQDVTFVRSGNPGYFVGQPVLAGQLVSETQLDQTVLYAIQLDGNRDNWMTIVTSGVNGQCISEPNNRVPVTFGENLRSGCFISVTYNNMSDLCNVINTAAWEALRGPNPPEYVGTFGNSQVETVGDWVQIFGDNSPQASNPANNAVAVCENVLVGMTIEIIYANVGSLANPQPQIIGASYQYQYQTQVRFQCMGAYCQPGNENMQQKLQVVSAVNFIDASDPAQGVSAERPRVTATLPEDFFYPFT